MRNFAAASFRYRFCTLNINIRTYSSFRNRGTRGNSINAIDVNASLRQFYKRSHPDVLRSSNPHYADVNSESMQVLNGILSTVKVVNSYPPRTVLDIPFYVKMDTNNQIEKHQLSIRTGGGECKKQLKASLEQFFLGCGILKRGDVLAWSKEYFPINVEGSPEDLEAVAEAIKNNKANDEWA